MTICKRIKKLQKLFWIPKLLFDKFFLPETGIQEQNDFHQEQTQIILTDAKNTF